MDNSPVDAELITRVAHRDRQALEILYDHYASAALGLAIRMMGDRAAGEEIVQEAFWRVWSRAGTFDTARGKFLTWLFSIVHHLSIDELRRRRGQPVLLELDADREQGTAEIPDEQMDVPAQAWSNIVGSQVRQGLARLPQAQRAAIELAYFEGYTHQEIAERLDEPIGTVHTRIRLGLLKLRELLGELGPDEK